jgi:dTDP-4-dehydrorhamnose 3,5-epimerase
VRPTELQGVLVIEGTAYRDERGFLFESYHRARFVEAGIRDQFVQDNHSRSRKGVLRGFHYQDATAPMAKLVRCTTGVILDVAVDLRLGSPTFGRWFATELSQDNLRQVFVPVGFGHAFLALSEPADVQYKCTGFYTPSAEGTIVWNDPDVGVRWPIPDPIVSDKDAAGVRLAEYRRHPAFRYPREA